MSIEKRTATIVSQTLKVKTPREFKPDDSFTADIGFDSLNFMELVVGLETEFDIKIEDCDSERLTTFQDAVDLVLSKLHP